MPNTASVTWSARPPSYNAPKRATKKHVVPTSKRAAANFTIWGSSQAACVPVSHHRIKGALSN